MSRHGAAIIGGAFNSAAEALGVAIACRQGGDLAAVDKHCLRIVSASIIELVWKQ